MSKIFQIVATALGLLLSLINAAEQPGTGADKKASVIAAFKQLIGQLGLPAWAVTLFSMDALLSILVDLIVAGLNKTGWFDENPT